MLFPLDLGSLAISLFPATSSVNRAYENIQVNQVVRAVVGANSLSDGVAMVTVTSGNGRIGAYLSVVDNATGDPTFIAIAPQSPFGG